ncbi:hypothetical protein [Aquimarina sp. 2304DJ70-9]|uniref:hypothetical protein n=1 Tax=Aquimarina penaris TaxID=3231044 RepID=UPI00346355BC
MKEVKYIIIGFLITLIALSGLYKLLNGYLYKEMELDDGTKVSVGRTPDLVDTFLFFFLVALGTIGILFFLYSLIKFIKKLTR